MYLPNTPRYSCNRHEHILTCVLNLRPSRQLSPTSGMIRKNMHVRIARYHQHLHELLDLNLTPLEYMMKEFPEIKEKEEMRKVIGRYGLTGKQQVSGHGW